MKNLILATISSLFFTGAYADSIRWNYDGFGAPKSISEANGKFLIENAFKTWQNCAGKTRFSTDESPTGYRIFFTWASMENEMGKTTLMPNEKGMVAIVSFDPKSVNSAAKMKDVAIHEIGHALGLPHSVSRNSVMNGENIASAPKTPTNDDIEWCTDMNASKHFLDKTSN